MSFLRAICRSKTPLPAPSIVLHDLLRIPTTTIKDSSPSSSSTPQFTNSPSFTSGISFCHFHDGRPRGPLWRGKKMIGKEALFAISGLKRYKDDEEKLEKFIKTHVSRLLKMDMIAVLVELERQDEVTLALKIFRMIQKEDWYKPDKFLYKDLIMALAKCKKMDDAMQLWETMRKEDLFPDSQTYTEVIRGFLRCGSPADAMNIYEDMKQSPDPPEELPFRILLKGLLPHPLLRNRVKQDFEEIFPDSSSYDPPEEIFGLR
ncbi:protein THYLAKOID ASSEMBLY 8-like, chloroplastic [Rhododendron vialii]|uniref:protein THYLAKOID ASSEMBLY 8-like, chloroplastic n=1 Tax=Rhododendron vialii TaxID=182163 RepID=UPI00265DEA62|nr:protein THYLAKOID ASSEMBLY 8-like, chloroplastic [Rhododendron vialii]XP_058226008.1 protein THYLAKOID ASSEMBLY 8-like, chloroplastic [Rhododendron vialii]